MVYAWWEVYKVIFKSQKKSLVSNIEYGNSLLKKKKQLTPKKYLIKSKSLFKQNSSKTNAKKQSLNTLKTKTLRNQQSVLCKNEIRETDLLDSMKNMINNNLMFSGSRESVHWETNELMVLSTQKSDVFHKDRQQSQQTSHVKSRFTGKSGRLISDIIEISDWFNTEGLLVTMDIEKAFDRRWPPLFS